MKGNLPLVSIIVPNYNHEKYLEQRLDCIFNQSYDNFEVILLDDCSTDKSQEILLEYTKNPKVSHCVFNEINTGNTFVQWNKGISLAKGDYIWIAESDDFCELNFLEEVSKPLIENEEVVLSYCQSNHVDASGVVLGTWKNHTDSLDSDLFSKDFIVEGNVFIEKFLIYKNVIPNASGVLFRRDRANELGELDLDPLLRTCGDWLFYLKMMTNYKMAFCPPCFNNFRYHPASVIAVLIKKDSEQAMINMEIKARKKITSFLLPFKTNGLSNSLKINRNSKKILNYNVAMYYLRNNNKIKGSLILMSVLDVFMKKFKFKEYIKKKNFFLDEIIKIFSIKLF